MKISVIYSGGLYKITHKSFEQLEVDDNINVLALISVLEQKYGKEIQTALIDGITGKCKIPVFVNGKNQSLDYVIQENDRVAFMFIVTGG